VGLSLGGLVVGALLGTAVANWLRVDIVPLGVSGVRLPKKRSPTVLTYLLIQLNCTLIFHPQNFQAPGVICTEFVIITHLLGSLFLI
jgi:hypothetical protein